MPRKRACRSVRLHQPHRIPSGFFQSRDVAGPVPRLRNVSPEGGWAAMKERWACCARLVCSPV
ncbi:hypothetical protein Lokhon_00094 (plasmid) [Limimaricola hongkongensis DSM 17492]|uniref:Uncharacterized protein n=1 Tax=Limimaricola hongkongensis DSM 17492 TaxID=1122180 RepID=A0A017H7P9_9RHOB|nr:hypothetical protein Lokhon_00094 [Limimaricola hongkongensis DSM 17492]